MKKKEGLEIIGIIVKGTDITDFDNWKSDEITFRYKKPRRIKFM